MLRPGAGRGLNTGWQQSRRLSRRGAGQIPAPSFGRGGMVLDSFPVNELLLRSRHKLVRVAFETGNSGHAIPMALTIRSSRSGIVLRNHMYLDFQPW